MAEASAGEMIELNFGDEFVVQGLPFHGMFCAPAAKSAGGFAGESGGLDHFFEFLGQGGAVFVVDGRTEAYVVEFAFVVVEAEKQGTDQAAFFRGSGNPPTTQSAVLWVLIFCMPVRSPV